MLTVLSAGLPISAKDILKNAMDEVFDGAVVLQELNKNNLRSRVRLSNKNVEIVLVVLDGVSSDLCRDIEGGLFHSDKYYAYTTDKELAGYLNNKYGLSIVVEDDIEEISETESDGSSDYKNEELVQFYEEKLQIKQDTIDSLERRIREVTAFYEISEEEYTSGVSSEEYDSLKEELSNLREKNISLSNDILSLNSEKDELSKQLDEVSNSLASSEEESRVLETRFKKVSADYERVLSELNDLKVSYSKQSGVIRDKDRQLAELEGSLESFDEIKNSLSEAKKDVNSLKKKLSSREATIDELRVDVASKDRDIQGYKRQIESLKELKASSEQLKVANGTIDDLRSEVASLSSENADLNKRLLDKERLLGQLSEANESLSEVETELRSKIDELNARVSEDDANITQLNRDKLDLQSQVNMLKQSVNVGEDTEPLLKEINDLRDKIASMSSNVFNRIGSMALPNGTVKCRILNGSGRFQNIQFAFSGSSESRKGTYRCLLEKFRSNRDNSKYLIVDLVSETSVDYVFEIKRVVPGIEWLRRGGSVQSYVSATALGNVKVLSMGLGYINDSYLLCVDWAKRLMELDNSGYKVIVFCGDISNIVGRVLYDSFALYGETYVYVQGNAVGSRAVITNLRGLSNAKEGIVVYYNLNPSVRRFVNIVEKTNKVQIFSAKVGG